MHCYVDTFDSRAITLVDVALASTINMSSYYSPDGYAEVDQKDQPGACSTSDQTGAPRGRGQP
jgi:hypothetical protein